MNVVMLRGRWTKDPEITAKNEGTVIAKGTLAVDRWNSKMQTRSADFISVVAFGKTAEHIQKYYKKGTMAIIRGNIKTGSYDGKNGKVYTTDVIIDEIEFGESKGKSEEKPDQGFVDVPEDIDRELPFN